MAKSKKQYQGKFTSLEEAIKDARKQSAKLRTSLAVFQSRYVFYVDANLKPEPWEELKAVYKDGKKVK